MDESSKTAKIKSKVKQILNKNEPLKQLTYQKQTKDEHNILLENEDLQKSSAREDKRIKYWEVLSQWDPNFSELYLDEELFTQDYNKYKYDNIDKLPVAKNPIIEFIHNRIVEFIPIGIHNIWFYAIQNCKTMEFCYSDFGNGIKIDCNWTDLNINEMMKYVESLWLFCLDVIIIDKVWSDIHKCFCKCFQFRGFLSSRIPTIGPFKLTIPTENEIREFYPDYYNRTFTYSYPFSNEQSELRAMFNAKLKRYFYDNSISKYNRLQEKPIMHFIHDFTRFETVRHSVKSKGIDSIYFRTYRLEFHQIRSQVGPINLYHNELIKCKTQLKADENVTSLVKLNKGRKRLSIEGVSLAESLAKEADKIKESILLQSINLHNLYLRSVKLPAKAKIDFNDID